MKSRYRRVTCVGFSTKKLIDLGQKKIRIGIDKKSRGGVNAGKYTLIRASRRRDRGSGGGKKACPFLK